MRLLSTSQVPNYLGLQDPRTTAKIPTKEEVLVTQQDKVIQLQRGAKNDRMVWVERDLSRSPSPNSLQKLTSK